MAKPIEPRRLDGRCLWDLRCAATAEMRREHHRLGARLSPAGLLFWCKDCREQHLISWAELEEYRQMVAIPAHLR